MIPVAQTVKYAVYRPIGGNQYELSLATIDQAAAYRRLAEEQILWGSALIAQAKASKDFEFIKEAYLPSTT